MASKTAYSNVHSLAKFPLDYQPHTCRWIDGDGVEKEYTCKEEAVKGRSYCEDHMARVYVKPQDKAV